MAAPHVSGISALLLSINSSLTPSQIRNIIQQTADDLGSSGLDNYYGYGRVNAYKALKYTLENYGGTIAQSFTIPAGETWNIAAGVTIKLASGVNLTVNGVLNVNGTSSQPVYFTRSGLSGTWGSIVLSGSGSAGSTFSYLNMQYGTNIQATSTSGITIQNSTFSNNNNAVTFTGASGTVTNCYISNCSQGGIIAQSSSNITCNYTTIKNSYFGIAFTGGSGGFIGQNDIDYNSYYGIGVGSSCAPAFKNVPYAYSRNNRITNCGNGVYITSTNSLPVMYNATNCNGLNTIYDNSSYDINNLCSYYLDAIGVYWKNGNPANAIINGIVYTSPYCSTDPWSGIPLPKQNSGNFQSIDPLIAGIQLRTDGKLREAKDFYLAYLAKNPDNQKAYTELYFFYSNETAGDIIKYYESLPRTGKDQDLILCYLYLKQGNYKSAKEICNGILAGDINSHLKSIANLNNFYITLYYENDQKNAASILAKLESVKDRSNEMEISLAKYALQNYVAVNISLAGNQDNGLDKKTVKVLPTEFNLEQNYPNPFNPETKISFSISQKSHVKLKVFDVLGREISMLVNGFYEPGRYEVEFIASKLPSGIYFYSLTAGNNTLCKKMLLLK